MSTTSAHGAVRSKQSLFSFFEPHLTNSTPNEESNHPEEPHDPLPSPQGHLLTHEGEPDIVSPSATFPHFLSDDEEDDDGLDADPPVRLSPSEEDDGDFGDEEQVDVAVDAYSWKINHANGHHRLRSK